MDLAVKLERVPDLLRAISMKVSVEDGKICNYATMRKRLERLRLSFFMR